jgi:hypothetical protein
MNKLLTKIAGVALGLTMAIGVGIGLGVGSSKETVPVKATTGYNSVYTLDTTASGVTTTTNNYASAGTVTVSSVGWSFTGNGQQQPWRLGGKSLSKVNRPFYTTSAISNGVDRIEFTFGTASSITVNSFTVSVHSTATGASGGTDALETLTPTFAASSTVGVNLASTRTGCFYRFVMNVTVSGTSNKFVQVSKVDFLQTSKTLSSITASLTDSSATWYVGDTVTASDLTVTPHYSDGTDGTPITDGTGVTVTNGTLSSVGTNAVNVSYDGKSTTVSVTAQAARTITGIVLHGTISKDEYYVGDAWDLTGLDLQVNWSTGAPTFVDLDDDDVAYECTPATALDTFITSFDIEVMYDEQDEIFTISGITVSVAPDILTREFTGVSGTTYTDWSGKNGTSGSGAVYAGNSAGPTTGNTANSIQLRTTNPSGIWTTTSGGIFSKISVTWNSDTLDSRSLEVYGKDSAYASADLYSTAAATKGTLICTVGRDGTVVLEGDDYGEYAYIGIKPIGGACYLTEIDITWTPADPVIEYTDGGTTANLTVVNGSTNTITFEAENFASVSASLFSNNTGSHSSLGYTVSGILVTITATGTSIGDDVYTISATGCANTLTLNVTVQASTTFDSLVISTATTATSFNEDEAFAVTNLVVTANYTVGGSPSTVEFSASEGNLNQLTYTVGGSPIEIGDPLTSTGTLSVVVSYTDSATSTTRSAAAYNITVNAYVPHTWTKVTNAPADWRGTYLLGYEADGTFYAFNSSLATFDATFNNVNTTNVSSGVVTGSKTLDAVAVKIERNTVSGTSYYHALCANGQYLKSASKDINHQASATAANAVTFDGVSLKIGAYWLRFNTASNQLRFRFGDDSYLSSTTASLYKMNVTSAINTEVSNFVSGFDTAFGSTVCKTDGTTNVSTVNSNWTAQAKEFAKLSVDAQGILANTTYTHDAETAGSTADIIDRYDYIYGKYSASLTKGDFMNRSDAGTLVVYSTRVNSLNIVGENGSTAAIIVVSLISITALGGYFFIKKKKHQ